METIILLFAMPGFQELLVIGGIVILMFGGRKIPEFMKGLGKGISEFKKAKEGADEIIGPKI